MIAPIEEESDDKPPSWALVCLREAIRKLCESAAERGYAVTYDDAMKGRIPENLPEGWQEAFFALLDLHTDELAFGE